MSNIVREISGAKTDFDLRYLGPLHAGTRTQAHLLPPREYLRQVEARCFNMRLQHAVVFPKQLSWFELFNIITQSNLCTTTTLGTPKLWLLLTCGCCSEVALCYNIVRFLIFP